MRFFAVVLGALLSIFSTAIMSYISMATPIGPWIAPTLALITMIIARGLPRFFNSCDAALSVVSASVGGILATACGFSFPALYFLQKPLFESWLAAPWIFIGILAGLSVTAGCLAFWLADILEPLICMNPDLGFPVARLVDRLLQTGSATLKQSYFLFCGLGSALCYGTVQAARMIPRTVVGMHELWVGILHIPPITIDTMILPMLLAIGYVTGQVIAVPLLVGAAARIFLLEPLHTLFIPSLSCVEWTLAWCSGMILVGTIIDIMTVFKGWIIHSRQLIKTKLSQVNAPLFAYQLQKKEVLIKVVQLLGIIFFGYAWLRIFSFSFATVLYLIFGSLFCCYQIVLIAGKIGLAPMGRFATFMMMPALILFAVDATQAIFISTFVELCCGITVDLLTGRVIANYMEIEKKMVRRFQGMGLMISACCVGIIFLYLIRYCTLGSCQLFAYKAQARQLLLTAHNFDIRVLCAGGLFGYFLKKVGINPGLVLGGLLMPINISIGLIIGGFMALLAWNHEKGIPFWSGIFAGNSLLMVVNAFLQ